MSMKTSTRSYLRPLGEHLIALTLIGGASIFSSLQNLGAVCIFTLEVSSAFLQLLQMCVNAPEGSWSRQTTLLWGLHWFLVVLAFL